MNAVASEQKHLLQSLLSYTLFQIPSEHFAPRDDFLQFRLGKANLSIDIVSNIVEAILGQLAKEAYTGPFSLPACMLNISISPTHKNTLSV